MAGMLPILKETDPVLIPGLLRVWGVKDDSPDRDDRLKTLAAAMEDPARVQQVWGGLSDDQRSAMQMIYHTPSRSLPSVHFERVAGPIRQMGSEEILRQDPIARPKGPAEALYFRGLISLRRENASTGMRNVLFIPSPLAPLLPINQTTYDQLDDEPLPMQSREAGLALEPLEEDELDDVRVADTSVVDDMTTLLAYLRFELPPVEAGLLPADVVERLQPFLLVPDRDRLRFLVALAYAAGLVGVEGGRIAPIQAEARRWLSLSRPDQIRHLAEVWRDSAILDMAHTPGLILDADAGNLHQYDPKAVRATVVGLLRTLVPLNEWWSQSDFVSIVREDNADFQRPNGNFDVWFIQDTNGTVLSGIAFWDQVEGALLEYLINGPLHWLGLADLADDAARFNVFGRAFMGSATWPSRPDSPESIEIRPDGIIVVTRKASRIDRYTVARFTTWLAGETPYTYRIDADGLERAAEQGITLELIRKFLDRHAPGGQLPASIIQFLDEWKHGAKAVVTLEQMLVLRTTSEATLDLIFNDPELRRFLGARLGPTAVITRADQWQPLKLALGERGIRMEVLE
ncbi:MAG: helicase-associated domain-containing protein [Anaerolineae bacterium]